MLREHRPGRAAAALLALLLAGATSLAGCDAAADTARPVGRGHEADDVAATRAPAGVPGEAPHHLQRQGLTLADGEVPAGTTVFDDSVPAVAKLDPGLLAALREAAAAAEHDGLQLEVNSGWRSIAYQRELFEQAITTYGSEADAARWVARPGTSVHEAGDAVDLGPAEATAWLAEHGAAYGLCRIYANEAWHFELRPAAVTDGCPAMYADADDDPRLQQ